MIWSDEILDRFYKEGQDHLVNEFPCLIDRLALDIVSGTGEYVIPDYVTNIRRITWKGRKIDPLPNRQMRETFQPSTQLGVPYYYIFDNIGFNTIKFFPTPHENLATITTNLFGSEIPNRCIIEYYRASDYLSFSIPPIVDRRIRKAFVLWKAFSIESKGQDSKAATYYKAKWDNLLKEFGSTLNELITAPRKLIISSKYIDSSAYPSTPILPMDKYGISVNTGE